MTDSFDIDQPHGVRVDQLQSGDGVLMFGRVIRVVEVRSLDEFPGILSVRIRPAVGGRDVDAMLPADWQLIAVDAPRTTHLRCGLCTSTGPVTVNLARGVPRRTICRRCSTTSADGPAHGA